jgi:Na+-driven multidrug efflux pump
MRQGRDLTKGAIVKSLWLFALPLMLGNVLQQLYNLVDTWVVGRYLGKRALAAVGASYTLMTFLTSVVIGLCLGAGAGGNGRGYGNVSHICICRIFCYIFV